MSGRVPAGGGNATSSCAGAVRHAAPKDRLHLFGSVGTGTARVGERNTHGADAGARQLRCDADKGHRPKLDLMAVGMARYADVRISNAEFVSAERVQHDAVVRDHGVALGSG